MKYIFELNHPKHYYQFKYIMSILEQRGHSIMVLARDKDVLLKVLQEEGVPYRVFGVHKESISGKVFSSFSIFRHYKRIAKEFSPDVIVSKASLYGTLVAKMLGCKSFIFPDSEVGKLTNKQELIDLNINTNTLEDRKSGISFDKYIVKRIKY